MHLTKRVYRGRFVTIYEIQTDIIVLCSVVELLTSIHQCHFAYRPNLKFGIFIIKNRLHYNNNVTHKGCYLHLRIYILSSYSEI